jgi:pimeloyl-ACP methyl ester carboxylesterase
MKTMLTSMKFLWNWSRDGQAAVRREQFELKLGQDTVVSSFLFEPLRGAPRGTVLFVHGMSFLGHEDPRQVEACEALASVGFRVVAPNFDEISDLRIRLETIERIGLAAQAAAEQFSSRGRVGIFSVSFSASMCLIAASRAEYRRYIQCVCGIGAFSSCLSCVRFLMQEGEVDEYGLLVLLRNFLPDLRSVSPVFERAIEELLKDNAFTRQPPNAPRWIAKLSGSERVLLNRYRQEKSARDLLCDDLGHYHKKFFEQLNVLAVAEKIDCPVTLIHGADDDVISPTESMRLFRVLKAYGKDCELVVTPLISHGDRQLSPRMFAQLFGLLEGFAHFLKAMEATELGTNNGTSMPEGTAVAA